MFALLALLLVPDESGLRVLEGRCVECHHAAKTKGGLDLSTREALLKGGETGPALVPGQPEKSRLWRLSARLDDPAMPHKRDKLPDAELRALAGWIAAGAPYSRELKPPAAAEKKGFEITEADRKHWAFQPVKRPEPPAVLVTDWVRTPIDRFILARIEAAGLSPAASASREALIRRVTFDLTGLPPTIDEIDAFIRDSTPDAWDKVVDRLLASPRYGERWGRHWLDLARFAETDGFEHDAVRPHAWRYRDYVIRAFNADKPFDQFVREQLAGDELRPDDPEALVATGFNLLGPDMVDSSDQVQRRLNTLSDMTDVTASVFLGLTLGCARCHDHKFEPLSQKDYYRLLAFFNPAAFRTERPVPTAEERASFDRDMESWRATPELRELDELEAPYRKKLRERKVAKLNDEMRAALATPPEQRNVEQTNLALEVEPMVEVSEKEINDAMTPAERARRKSLQAKLPKPPQLPKAATLAPGKPATTHVLYRGEYSMPREEVTPGFPEVLGARTAGTSRASLADWIASRENPLTARVIANRLWQHHFGRGIVPSPSEFGPRGRAPTHPELLDWLASELVERGWSLKAMHRLILTSATYLQSTASPHLARDPENVHFARMNRLRLEGEAIRDSLLFISGRLNERMFGPGVFPPVPSDVLKGSRGWTVSADPADHSRRSVYIFARRNLRFPFLEVFDAPDSNLSSAERGRSTTAPQSLTLLNAPEVIEAAKALAAKLENEPADRRVDLAYRRVLGRLPTGREAAVAREFLSESPLRELCRALFNLNAFVYVE
jgi:cytochrome c553